MNLIAKAASFTNDGYCSLLSLADDPINPQNCVLLAFTNEPDEQDTSMGMAGVHIDLGAWQVDGYDLVDDVSYENRIISVQINKEAASSAGIDQRIDVVLDDQQIGGVLANDIVAKFKERLASTGTPGHNTK
jgi:hypothetical protein